MFAYELLCVGFWEICGTDYGGLMAEHFDLHEKVQTSVQFGA